ncbi:MAG: thioredoxin domain-containing protein, partial [Chloroflexi bacterium]|nr:thioredoxin domain-containing protein [Chloroflexota bacterium]
FEDAEVARVLNEAFVCVKVDREERPDLDALYMHACQLMTGAGGWPLTLLLTPDRQPFFAATYLPRESRFGRIGMLELCARVKELWETRREEVEESALQITAGLQESIGETRGEELGEDVLKEAYTQFASSFDEIHGGFGQAPKFPTPHHLTFLLRYWKRYGEKRALEMVEKTLAAMRQGGIYDQIGFGFHRYSTDAHWFLPHFEKMLYDQAMLAIAYTEAYQATGKKEYRQVAEEIFTYVLRDMTSPEGGFYSAEDADSEGEEGKFYLWSEDEIREALGEESELISRIFNTAREGNFREEASGQQTGQNILYLSAPFSALSSEFGITEDELQEKWERSRQKLLAAREKRVHPHKDDKILTDWNGLMIATLAKASTAFGENKYRDAARRAAEFISVKMRNDQGRLYHRYREGETAVPGLLDDYAFMIWGILELYEASFQVYYLEVAVDLAEMMLEHFWDKEHGGFFTTADDGETVLVRRKEIYDGAIPSGNSVAMLDLLRLGRMTANTEFEEKAAEIARAFSKSVGQYPTGYTQLLLAVDFALGPGYEVVIVGDSPDGNAAAMLQQLRQAFIPNKVVLFRPSGQEAEQIIRLAEFTKEFTSKDSLPTAYVCENYQCQLPTTDEKKMMELLGVQG